MPAPESIRQLVARFTDQRDIYRSGKYNETQLRNDFLDPLFEALGWDVNNRKNYSEKFREVVKEVSLDVDGTAKAADYAFQSGGHVHFFVEAKKPAVNIESHPDSAFQIRRYGWSAKLNVSILSDFEQLAVYDCRQKPVHGDPAYLSRANLYSFTEYIDKWDEIAGLLSYEAVHQGSLDKFTDTLKGKRGTADVDDDFLATMEHWREELARVIALRNAKLTQREINTAVQLIIDRIIFLRICEDRGIEPENGLRDATDGIDVYGDLMQLFTKADKKYNSGLFHFDTEKGQSSYPDTLTPTLKIDDKVLKDILVHLYPPVSPYAFKYFSAEILGQVYERFLGKVIRLTAGGHAKVEEKPEVRKAGGVYYTPTYIVEYIVKNTVGELLKDKTPADLFLEPIRIVDPACGSGSFLLGAYQFLLDWSLNWYMANDPAKWSRGKNPPVFEADQGWQLTMETKKQLLTSHIFGVDIDSQAVEVTKLSLLLKVVENPGQLTLLGERILPDLGENIKCGNSLIGPDYYDNQQLTMFDSEEQYRVNAFDWHKAFPKPFAKGGFDAVIGNPPYVFGRDWKSLGYSDQIKTYFNSKFTSVSYQLDMFSIFMEQASNISTGSGFIGQIVPNVWLNNIYSENLRRFILNQSQKLKIVKPMTNVFSGLSVDTIVYSYQKSRNLEKTFQIGTISYGVDEKEIVSPCLVQEYLDGKKPISTNNISSFLTNIKSKFNSLNSFVNITRGVHPYRVGGYGKSAFSNSKQTQKDVDERPYHSKTQIQGYRGFVYGKDLKRFTPPMATEYISYGDWLAEPRKPSFFEGTRVYSRKILGDRLIVTVETADSIADQQVYISCPKTNFPNALFISGVLGSKFISYYIRNYYDEVDKNFPQIKVSQLSELPIPYPDEKNHDRMVNLVETMLNLHKLSAAARLPDEKERLTRQIESTDRQIDKLVYDLYGLTPDEIKIVEGS